MTPKERDKMIRITYERVDKMYNVKVNGVDGSKPVKGFQPVMEYLNFGIKGVKTDVANVKNDISDLKSLTHTLRTKRDVKVAIDKFLADRWFVRALYTFFTDKRTVATVILALTGWFTHEPIGKFIVSLFK